MSKIKEQFTKDFVNSTPKNLTFDTTKLEPNTRKTRHFLKPSRVIALSVCSAFASVIILFGVVIASALFQETSSIRFYTKRYSANEIAIADNNTFKKLNSVTYPSDSLPTQSVVTQEEKNAYANFSNLTYHSLVNTSKKDNISYSVSGLYSILNELEGAVSREDLRTRFNNLLGLNREERCNFYSKLIKANSYVRDNCTIQMKNSAFFTNEYDYSSDYVNFLTKLYCESYQADLINDSDKIVKWVNSAVNDGKFIDQKFLEVDKDTVLLYFSTLYFKNAWANKYLSSANINDDFHLSNGSTVKTTFMRHSYRSRYYYDYGKYISVKDYYSADNASVTFLVPKDNNDNIFDLTKDTNIFVEDDQYKVGNEISSIMVNLKTPKFTAKCDVNFLDTLSNLGFEDMFDDQKNSFANAFNDPKINGGEAFTYLQKVKQRNEVAFNEDGTIVKSVSMAAMGAKSVSIEEQKTLDVSLDQPFIYIIKDCNNTPIFVGHIDNPTL